jgi:hypothetical protein
MEKRRVSLVERRDWKRKGRAQRAGHEDVGGSGGEEPEEDAVTELAKALCKNKEGQRESSRGKRRRTHGELAVKDVDFSGASNGESEGEEGKDTDGGSEKIVLLRDDEDAGRGQGVRCRHLKMGRSM